MIMCLLTILCTSRVNFDTYTQELRHEVDIMTESTGHIGLPSKSCQIIKATL